MVALKGVAQFLDLLGSAAILVDQDNLYFQAAKTDHVIWLYDATRVERVDYGLGPVRQWLSKGFRGRSGKEGDKAKFENLVVLRCATNGRRAEQRRDHQNASRKTTIIHGWDLPLRIIVARIVWAPRVPNNVPNFGGSVHGAKGNTYFLARSDHVGDVVWPPPSNQVFEFTSSPEIMVVLRRTD